MVSQVGLIQLFSNGPTKEKYFSNENYLYIDVTIQAYVTNSIKQASTDRDLLAANSISYKLEVSSNHTSLTNLIPWLIQSPIPFSQPTTYTTSHLSSPQPSRSLSFSLRFSAHPHPHPHPHLHLHLFKSLRKKMTLRFL